MHADHPRIGLGAAHLAVLAVLVAGAGCNGQIGGAPGEGEAQPPTSALAGSRNAAAQRPGITYPEAVVIEPNDAYAATCTGVLVAPSVVLTAAHCVAFVASQSWQVTAPYATGGVERRTAREGEPMDAAFKNLSRADYIHYDLRDVGALYLERPFAHVLAAKLDPAPLLVTKEAPPIYVASVGLAAEGREEGPALSPVTTLEAATGARAALAYATARVTADGESGGPLFVEGTHQLVAVHARALGGPGDASDLWSRLDGDVYTWLTQKVASHGGWVAPPP
jgi:hypothetical protein